jgi:hypothetical protein
MNKIFVTTMNQDYFNSLGYKTLQSWLKNCKNGTIVLYAENFLPTWDLPNQIINWDDSLYERLVIKNIKLDPEWERIYNLLNGRARNFIWKAASWTQANNDYQGVITFFDADLVCFNDPNILIDEFIKNDYDASILSVKDKRPHADSCFYSINSIKSSNIVTEYKNQYNNFIFDKEVYPKPYDAPVLSKTLDILKNKIKIWDFNNGSDAKSPLKDTVLNEFFRHLKANQKDSGRLLGLIDKTINALDKDKNIIDVLTRFDRKLRQDDSKKLDVPF